MDVQQLRYFVSVAELGGLARAADILDVPQPTLSRQIRALELAIGASLFHRHGRGVTLTDAGNRFLPRAKTILKSVDRALLELHEGDSRLRGHIVCGLTPSVGRMMISEYVRRFNERLPLARLSVINLLSSQRHDQLRASRIDFAILHSPPPASALVAELLGRQDLYLVGRTAVGPDPSWVDVSNLDGLRLVMPSAPHVTRQPLEAAAARHHVGLRIEFEVDAVDSLFDLVAAGFAHTVSTRVALASKWAEPNLVVQRIVNPAITTELYLSSPAPSDLTPLQEVARDLARAVFYSTCGHLTHAIDSKSE